MTPIFPDTLQDIDADMVLNPSMINVDDDKKSIRLNKSFKSKNFKSKNKKQTSIGNFSTYKTEFLSQNHQKQMDKINLRKL